ncbi:uncharacterized protein [Hoplias malabaricus]
MEVYCVGEDADDVVLDPRMTDSCKSQSGGRRWSCLCSALEGIPCTLAWLDVSRSRAVFWTLFLGHFPLRLQQSIMGGSSSGRNWTAPSRAGGGVYQSMPSAPSHAPARNHHKMYNNRSETKPSPTEHSLSSTPGAAPSLMTTLR